MATQVRFQLGLECQTVPGEEEVVGGKRASPGHPSWLGWGLSYRLLLSFPPF